jgi:bacterioferritin-associated ferredoxin
MIVCNCRGASERDVRNAVGAGANCLEKLERCGIGGDCRGCENMLRDLVVEMAGNRACQCCLERPAALATA